MNEWALSDAADVLDHRTHHTLLGREYLGEVVEEHSHQCIGSHEVRWKCPIGLPLSDRLECVLVFRSFECPESILRIGIRVIAQKEVSNMIELLQSLLVAGESALEEGGPWQFLPDQLAWHLVTEQRKQRLYVNRLSLTASVAQIVNEMLGFVTLEVEHELELPGFKLSGPMAVELLEKLHGNDAEALVFRHYGAVDFVEDLVIVVPHLLPS